MQRARIIVTSSIVQVTSLHLPANAGGMRFLLVLAQTVLKWAGRRHMARNGAHQWEEMSMGLGWNLPAAGCRGNGCCAWITHRVLAEITISLQGWHGKEDRNLTFEMFNIMACTFRFNTVSKIKIMRNWTGQILHSFTSHKSYSTPTDLHRLIQVC